MPQTNMFNEATLREILLISWEKHLSKRSAIIDDGVIKLL